MLFLYFLRKLWPVSSLLVQKVWGYGAYKYFFNFGKDEKSGVTLAP